MMKRWFASMDKTRKERPFLFWLRCATIAGVALLFIVKRNFWTPDTLFIVLLAVFVVLGQARAFILRFAPFVLLLLAYDSFRSIADDLNHYVHYWEMINFDKWLFGGTLPTTLLQNVLWHGHVQWYDFYFYFLYTIHFLAPILLAVLLWKVRDELYWRFAGALVILSFAAFITFVIFPAAPPWMASDAHFITQIHRISSDVWAAMGVSNFSEVYNNISPNPVAAVPSLHSAYPLLFVLFLVKAFGLKRVWWAFAYPVSMWIGVVYLGEHYVFDVALGIIYAVAAFFGTMWLFDWLQKRGFDPWREYLRGFTLGRDWAHARKIARKK